MQNQISTRYYLDNLHLDRSSDNSNEILDTFYLKNDRIVFESILHISHRLKYAITIAIMMIDLVPKASLCLFHV